MALFQCPECNSQISNLALSCPKCGCPISNNPPIPDNLLSPSLDLRIGKKIRSWSGNAVAKGFYENQNSKVDKIPAGVVFIRIFEKGIRIYSYGIKRVKDIHASQIVNMYESSKLENGNSEVLGRAVAGTLLFGQLGGVIGGMSGINKKTMRYYLCIEYWDIESKTLTMLVLGCRYSVRSFINRYNKTITAGKQSRKLAGTIKTILLFLISICLLLMFIGNREMSKYKSNTYETTLPESEIITSDIGNPEPSSFGEVIDSIPVQVILDIASTVPMTEDGWDVDKTSETYRKYIGKIITVTGKVSIADMDAMEIEITETGDDGVSVSAYGLTPLVVSNYVSNYPFGNKELIKIQGRITSFDEFGITLENCIVLD